VKYVLDLDSCKEAVDQIIRFFAIMAKSMSVILSTRVSLKEWGTMKAIILARRQMYRKICESTAVAVQREGSSKLLSRSASPTASEAGSESNFGNHDETTSQEGFEVDLEISQHSQLKKVKDFRNLAACPNFHQGLHLAYLLSEHATTYNVCVSQGEDEHK
jgi:hypothetical protein